MSLTIAASYGFLTVVEVPEMGHCGGLLLLSDIGRPIEFHCTTPVKANRAQEILYGQTFQDFLFCDQIGGALFAKTKKQLDVVITDQAEMLALAGRLNIPFVLMQPRSYEPATTEDILPAVIQQDGYRLSLALPDPGESEWVTRACQQFTRTLPLEEPFERIRQAIEEAQAVAARV